MEAEDDVVVVVVAKEGSSIMLNSSSSSSAKIGKSSPLFDGGRAIRFCITEKYLFILLNSYDYKKQNPITSKFQLK